MFINNNLKLRKLFDSVYRELENIKSLKIEERISIMYDISLLLKKLSNVKLITETDTINDDVIKQLKDIPIQYQKMFIQGDVKYNYSTQCIKCAKKINIIISKTSMVSKEHKYLCDSCKKIEKKEKQELAKNDMTKIQDEQKQSAIEFINTFLDYHKFWKNLNKKSFYTIKHYYRYNVINKDIVAEYIKNMKYIEFIHTPYWQAISYYKKYKSKFQCQLCGNNKNIETHHRHYNNHGYEYENLDDLIVLCSSCHNRFHNDKE